MSHGVFHPVGFELWEDHRRISVSEEENECRTLAFVHIELRKIAHCFSRGKNHDVNRFSHCIEQPIDTIIHVTT